VFAKCGSTNLTETPRCRTCCVRNDEKFIGALLGFAARLLNFLRLLRGRLIGRTPDFESGYRGSSPRPGANFFEAPDRSRRGRRDFFATSDTRHDSFSGISP
jgi:hypothetical protein